MPKKNERLTPKEKNNAREDDFISVGVITGSYGVHGTFRVKSFSDVQDRFSRGRELLLRPIDNFYKDYRKFFPGGIPDKITILEVSTISAKEIFLLTVKEIQNREQAKVLKGSILGIDSSSKVDSKDKETFFHYQLVGLKVIYRDEELGTISRIHDFGATDIIEIKTRDREYLVPFTKEEVPIIDLEGGFIQINPDSGILEQ